jgi:hypothetical protein
MIVLEVGPIRKQFGLDEVMRGWSPYDGISVLRRVRDTIALLLSTM